MFRLENSEYWVFEKMLPEKFVMQSWTLAMPCRYNRELCSKV